MEGEKKEVEKDVVKDDEPKSAGIPEMEFLEDVDKYMDGPEINGNAESVLLKLEEQHSKYKFMEHNLLARKRRLNAQIPDLEKSVEMIKILTKKKEDTENFDLSFLLSEQCFMKASIPPTDKVCLWLGANVMLEYPLDEAIALLDKNIAGAKKHLDLVEKDLDFLRDQFTTTEVNMARVFNWNVKKRSGARAAAAAAAAAQSLD